MKSFSPIPPALRNAARRTGAALLSLFYPPHCAFCNAETQAGQHLCAKCLAEAPRVPEPFCQRCSQPFDGALSGPFECETCGDRKFHFECAVAKYRGRGVVMEFVHRFKYERHFHLRHPLADWMAESLTDPRITSRLPEALVPVPLHRARFREREFNQAAVLAKELSRRSKLPVLNCLRRIRYTTTQTRLSRVERMENLRGAFTVRQTSSVMDRHLLLIDDVLTTGSTVEECARVLVEAGAASVRVLTAARA